jgi:hypothetical protein
MLPCIYCMQVRFEEGKGSREHAILSALGGRKASRNICCPTCNTSLGTEIDEPLVKDLDFFSTMLGITTGRNKGAPTHKQFVTVEGDAYDLEPGGSFALSKARIEIVEQGGEVKLSFQTSDEVQTVKILKRVLDKYDMSPEAFEELPATVVRQPAPPLRRTLSIGGGTQARSLAKMMLTYFATLIHPNRLRDGTFDETIAYILGERPSSDVSYDFTTPFPQTSKFGEVDHRVFAVTSNSSRLAVGFLELFGALRWSAILSKTWNGPDLAKAYIVNPLTGEQKEGDVTMSLGAFDQKYPRHTEPEQIETAFQVLLRSIQKHQLASRRSEIIRAALDRHIRGKPGDSSVIMTEEMIAKVVNEIATEYTRLVMRLPSESKIDLKDLL